MNMYHKFIPLMPDTDTDTEELDSYCEDCGMWDEYRHWNGTGTELCTDDLAEKYPTCEDWENYNKTKFVLES